MSKFCNDCGRNVTPRRKFSWGVFFLTGFVFYPLAYIFQKKRCPMYNGSNFSKAKTLEEIRQLNQS